MRIRGAELFADHAFIDGAHGAALTLEVQEGGGPFTTLQSFRSLLDLLENTQSRSYVNQRYGDKPVQVTHEVSDVTSQGTQTNSATTTSDITAFVDYNSGNYQVTESGSTTEHKETFGEGTLRAFTWMPEGPLGFVRTERRYGDPANTPPNLSDLFGTDLPQTHEQFWGRIDDVVGKFEALGRPMSISVGGSGSLNFSLGAGGSVGASVSASGQIGGGVTRSRNTGQQGSVTLTESKTLEAQNRQTTSGTQTATTEISGESHDKRRVVRTDESVEVRKRGVSVQYDGNGEDILLVAIPLNTVLKGHDMTEILQAPVQGTVVPGGIAGLPDGPAAAPKAPRDVLRFRIDHLPPGTTVDVEFRGSILPRERVR
jgi:hypothetical protein